MVSLMIVILRIWEMKMVKSFKWVSDRTGQDRTGGE